VRAIACAHAVRPYRTGTIAQLGQRAEAERASRQALAPMNNLRLLGVNIQQ
jgi:hypothetical protein